MDRDSNAIAVMRELDDTACLAALDASEATKERLENAAHEVASEIVRSPVRLAGMIDRGDILLHKIPITLDGEPMTADRAIAYVIAYSMSDARFGLSDVGKAITEYLAKTKDVTERAKLRVDEQISYAIEVSHAPA